MPRGIYLHKSYKKVPIEQRFWSKVDIKDLFGCWEFQGSITEWGYGQIKSNGKMIKAHRFAWEFVFGKIPKGMQINHKCNNRRCCNVSHLYLGTAQQNVDDMTLAGRQARGEKHGKSRFTNSDIINIRKLNNDGYSKIEISEIYKTSASNIGSICRRKTWKHIQ